MISRRGPRIRMASPLHGIAQHIEDGRPPPRGVFIGKWDGYMRWFDMQVASYVGNDVSISDSLSSGCNLSRGRHPRPRKGGGGWAKNDRSG